MLDGFEWLFMQWFYNVNNNITAYAFVDVASINVINRGPFIWSRYLDCLLICDIIWLRESDKVYLGY